ncbi:MAG: VOC family protein [Candidatus Sericytochromatia bacterium]|nr:VOC family protein [Candidatus Sericytochromatia bacterium]
MIEDIIGNVKEFLDQLFMQIKILGIDITPFELDHICYRTSSEEEYQTKKLLILNYAKLLVESDVNGRLISTFKLNSSIRYNDRQIFLLELPAPKKGISYKSGLEHIELVIQDNFDIFMKKYPKIEWNIESINKKLNPEIKIKLENDLSVKFHHLSLKEVIEREKSEISLLMT